MPRVAIDCFHEHLAPVASDTAIVAVDVIRASTTAVTALVEGWHVYPAGSIESAVRLAADLDRPILAGELGGVMPYGFDMQNSPTQVAGADLCDRPLILLSTSGTRLMAEAALHGTTYVACLRNSAAQAAHVSDLAQDVLILGADSRGEFREEDQLCAARMARRLTEAGYDIGDAATEAVMGRFADAPLEVMLEGRSARYLRDTGQQEDLDFVMGHVDDVELVFRVDGREIRPAEASGQA